MPSLLLLLVELGFEPGVAFCAEGGVGRGPGDEDGDRPAAGLHLHAPFAGRIEGRIERPAEERRAERRLLAGLRLLSPRLAALGQPWELWE